MNQRRTELYMKSKHGNHMHISPLELAYSHHFCISEYMILLLNHLLHQIRILVQLNKHKHARRLIHKQYPIQVKVKITFSVLIY